MTHGHELFRLGTLDDMQNVSQHPFLTLSGCITYPCENLYLYFTLSHSLNRSRQREIDEQDETKDYTLLCKLNRYHKYYLVINAGEVHHLNEKKQRIPNCCHIKRQKVCPYLLNRCELRIVKNSYWSFER